MLEAGDRTATGEDLVITEADLENLIRTKAAIYAACSLMLENVGLTGTPSLGSTSRVVSAATFRWRTRCSSACCPTCRWTLSLHRKLCSDRRLHCAAVPGASPQTGGNRLPHDLCGSGLRSAIHGQLYPGHVSTAHRSDAVSKRGGNMENQRRNKV